MQEEKKPLAVEMLGISKAWPGVVANDQVNLAVKQGEIHALVGENGAGKSTLMNILYGLIRPDQGQILIRGQEAHIHGPRNAIKLGIGMVHQHFMLIPPFTVVENIVLGHEPGGNYSRFLYREAKKRIQALSEQYGLPINADERIERLPVGMQQRVEILKVLYRGADILIMDEPTGVLTPQETDELFAVLRGLVQQGKTIIFITHKLREVLSLTDSITILRRGRNAGTLVTSETNQAEIARLMVGRDVLLRVEKEPAQPGPVVLKVENLSADSRLGREALHNLNFEIRAGEILGFAGVEGNGQSELAEAITGMLPIKQGHISLNKVSDGKAIETNELTNRGAKKVRRLGLAHIPEDRRESGLVISESVADNTVLGRVRWPKFSQAGTFLRPRKIRQWAKELSKDFDIRTASIDTAVSSLSGGNQQKVIIARELATEPIALVAAQPTRGVDIGAIESIHRRLIAERDAGKAILLISAELDEIRSLSDRIAVLFEGRIVAILDAHASEEEIGMLMTCGQPEAATTTEQAEL